MKKILILLSFLFLGFSAQAATTAGDGKKPKGGSKTIEFTEDLRLGDDEKGEHFLWSGGGVGIEVDSQENMYVIEPTANRVLQFDSSGKFVRQVGGPGEGPGEFQFLRTFKILADQSAIAFDNNATQTVLTKFDKNLVYVSREEKVSSNKVLRAANFNPKGDMIYSLYFQSPGGPDQPAKIKWGILDKEFNDLKTLTEVVAVDFDTSQVTNPSYWSEFLSHYFGFMSKGVSVVAFAPNGTVYSAQTDKYKITKWRPDLSQKEEFSREYKPLFQSEEKIKEFVEPIREELLAMVPAHLREIVSEEVVGKAVEMADIPPRKNPVFSLIPLDNEGVIVVHDHDPKSLKTVGDIFDANGTFLGTVTLPKISVSIFEGFFGNPIRLIFRGGHAYAMESSDGALQLVRYKYSLKAVKK